MQFQYLSFKLLEYIIDIQYLRNPSPPRMNPCEATSTLKHTAKNKTFMMMLKIENAYSLIIFVRLIVSQTWQSCGKEKLS